MGLSAVLFGVSGQHCILMHFHTHSIGAKIIIPLAEYNSSHHQFNRILHDDPALHLLNDMSAFSLWEKSK